MRHGQGGFRLQRAQQLCNAKIEQLDRPIVRNKYVLGFQIAVYDIAAVGILDRRADLPEQGHALADPKLMLVAKGIDGRSFDILHDEVRNALLRCASVENARDVGVIKCGKDFPFLVKPRKHPGGYHLGPGQLDGYALTKYVVGSGGQIDGAHAAGAYLAKYFVSADAPALHARTRRHSGFLRRMNGNIQNRPGVSMGLEQCGHFGAQRFVPLAGLLQERAPGVRVALYNGVEQVPDLPETIWRHRVPLLCPAQPRGKTAHKFIRFRRRSDTGLGY